jgi:hypothetical protein
LGKGVEDYVNKYLGDTYITKRKIAYPASSFSSTMYLYKTTKMGKKLPLSARQPRFSTAEGLLISKFSKASDLIVTKRTSTSGR